MVRSRLKLVLVLLLTGGLALPVAPLHAQDTSGPRVTGDLLVQVDTLIRDEMAYYHIPGAAVAVIQDGEVLFSQGFGVRSLETGEPFTPQTLFRIGSTTKSMTSLLVAQLVDEGRLTWDTPVTDLYPAFATPDPALTEQMLVRDLMGMGTGLEDTSVDNLYWGNWTVDDLFTHIASMSIAGEFRNHYFYNNGVYAAAGYVATQAAGLEPTLENYVSLMEQRVFEPAGMDTAIITDDRTALGDNYSESYQLNLAWGVDHPQPGIGAPLGVVAPAGAVWASLDDMSAYLIMQMNGGVTQDGTRIVSEENLAETWKPGVSMQSDVPQVDLRDLRYGMGWFNAAFHGVPTRQHDGGWEGYRTQMVVFPDANAGLLIFCNHEFGDLFNLSLTYAFAEYLYGWEPAAVDFVHTMYQQSVEAGLEPVAGLAGGDLDVATVTPWLGSYEDGWTLELRDDTTLWFAHPYWQSMLVSLPSGKMFFGVSGPLSGVIVSFDEEGDQVTMVAMAQGLTIRLAKVN